MILNDDDVLIQPEPQPNKIKNSIQNSEHRRRTSLFYLLIYFEMINTKCNIPFCAVSETQSRVKLANQRYIDIKNLYRRVKMGNTQKGARFTEDDLAFLMAYAGVQKSSLKTR